MKEQVIEDKIIARENEVSLLEEKFASNSAEFIAVYGRRRVGKTYLIKHFFSKKSGIFFEQTGLNNGLLHEQLVIFAGQLSACFYNGAKIAVPENWLEAFQQLSLAIDNLKPEERITIFFDELPWLATHKSGFIKALEYYWNTRWTNREKLILIVCGSAASWMLENVIYAKGGLHNRITAKIPLQPFTLGATEQYLRYLGLNLNRYQILQLYMAIGGIPHYLKAVRKGLSTAQNINRLCFDKNGLLFKEFDILFHSLYDEPAVYISMIRAIASKAKGIGREELIRNIDITDGGYLNTRLRSLEEAGFILAYLPIGNNRRGVHYRVIDEYTKFYLTWIEPLRTTNIGTSFGLHYWESLVKKPAWSSWAGYAFEAICYKHIDAIKKALDIEYIPSLCSDWQYRPKDKTEDGTQIDLVFEREDGCTTLCEMKYSEKPYLITKEYAKTLKKKEAIYREKRRSNKQIFWAMIAAAGVVPNEYLKQQIDKVIVMEDLFFD